MPSHNCYACEYKHPKSMGVKGSSAFRCYYLTQSLACNRLGINTFVFWSTRNRFSTFLHNETDHIVRVLLCTVWSVRASSWAWSGWNEAATCNSIKCFYHMAQTAKFLNGYNLRVVGERRAVYTSRSPSFTIKIPFHNFSLLIIFFLT